MVRRYLASVTLPVTPPAETAEEEASGVSANCSRLMSTVTSLVPFGSFPESRSSCHPSAVRMPGQAGAPAPPPACAGVRLLPMGYRRHHAQRRSVLLVAGLRRLPTPSAVAARACR